MTNIQIEDVSEVKKKLTFEVPEDRVRDAIDAQYRDLKKTVQIKGFRKGKVPLNILRSYFREKVEADTARQIIEETFQPGLDENKIAPVSVISIEPEALETGKPFKYIAEIEVPPPIDVRDYKGLVLKKYLREVKEEDVDERIEKLRERNARLTPITDSRGVTKGDHLVVDIKANVDGAAVPALTVTDYHLEVGRDFYLPEFDANLEGMKPEETKSVNLDLPQNFPRKAIAGKTASFEITLKEAKERILPELDDDFAKDLGEYATLDDLKEEIRKDLAQSLENQTKREIENQIVDALVESNVFEVPEGMVENQVDTFLNQSMQNLAMHGIDLKRLPAPTETQRAQMKPAAIRAVKAGLILKAVGEKEAIEVSDDELSAAITERAQQFGMSEDYLRDQLEQGSMLDDLRASVLQDKIYKFIQDNAEIREEEPPSEAETPKQEEEK
ncbi:MAG TPA: trigger factor [Desulfomonilaceae bacterium]|nr:trigger factor [Desulfomonilaceae bacterium]